MSAPHIRITQSRPDEFYGTYRGCTLHLFREGRQQDWYIIVHAPDGSYSYDGYWRDSAGKTLRQAQIEAVRGAGLWKQKEAA